MHLNVTFEDFDYEAIDQSELYVLYNLKECIEAYGIGVEFKPNL